MKDLLVRATLSVTVVLVMLIYVLFSPVIVLLGVYFLGKPKPEHILECEDCGAFLDLRY